MAASTFRILTAAITVVSLAAPVASAGERLANGISVGSGGVSVGSARVRTSDPVLDSVMIGANVGAIGGPIGLAVGAGLGYLHGLWARKKQEEQARAEAVRQQAVDRQLEREIAQARGNGSPEEQGVRIVKDHLLAADAEGFRSVFSGERLVRRERRAPDGSLAVVLHYDEQGQLVRREESSRLDGRLDTSTVYAQGRPERKESDTDDDGKPDVWATYTADGKVSVLESLMADGRRLRQRYTEGKVTREEWRTADALVTARDLDASGTVVREEEFGAGGRLSSVTFYESGRLVRRELYQVDERLFKRVPLVSSGGTGTP